MSKNVCFQVIDGEVPGLRDIYKDYSKETIMSLAEKIDGHDVIVGTDNGDGTISVPIPASSEI